MQKEADSKEYEIPLLIMALTELVMDLSTITDINE
uniref:Transcriptional regulator n=1 Tax=Heterorhabditis bacteriophora TaxID=37862 RepID=A0A1I7WK17_HETBA